MTRPSLRLTGVLIALFVLGGALGFAAGTLNVFRHPGPPFRPRMGRALMIERLDHELRLSADQRSRIQSILERNFTALRQRRDASRLEMRASRDSTQQAIEALLDPAQKERYRRIIERTQARWGHPRNPGDSPED